LAKLILGKLLTHLLPEERSKQASNLQDTSALNQTRAPGNLLPRV
jgi:hypothetical protein